MSAQEEHQGRRYDIVGLGSIVLDRIAFTPRIIGPEEKISLTPQRGAPFQDFMGGLTVNHLAWASLLGMRSGIVGLRAEDEASHIVRRALETLGVEATWAPGGSATPIALIFVDPQGERAIYMARGANAEVTPEHCEGPLRETICSAQIVSTEISQVPLSTVVRTLELAKEAGALTALDVDIPLDDALASLGTRQEFDRALSLADIIKPASGPLTSLFPKGTLLEKAMRLRDHTGARWVAVTAGAQGCALLDEGFEGLVPAAAIERAVDSTGAGDAFFGGLLAGICRGWHGESLGALANACGATCCEVVGAVPDHPGRLDEAVARLSPERRAAWLG